MPIYHQTAPAKINLTLRVLGRRIDGYHELESLVAFADAGDTVTLDTDRACAVEVAGSFATAIAGPNLVRTALDLATATEPRLRLGHVRLDKYLPIAAGLGGGSSDAAALLRALQAANPDLAPAIDWAALALRLGADVPVCLLAQSAWMRGIGERLEPTSIPALAAVLVTPDGKVPADKTRQVFATLAAPPFAVPASTLAQPANPTPPTRSALVNSIRRIGNDLSPAAHALMPASAAATTALAASRGCELAQLSGAGPTAFGVFTDLTAARFAATELHRAHPRWWVKPVSIGEQ